MHLGHFLDPLPPCLPQFLICSRHGEDGSSVCYLSQCPHPVSLNSQWVHFVLVTNKETEAAQWLASSTVCTSLRQKEAHTARVRRCGWRWESSYLRARPGGAWIQRRLWGRRRMTSCPRLFPALRAGRVAACRWHVWEMWKEVHILLMPSTEACSVTRGSLRLRTQPCSEKSLGLSNRKGSREVQRQQAGLGSGVREEKGRVCDKH